MEEKSHIQKASDWLFERQLPEGYWNAHLETNCCMEAQWLMACKFCGIESAKNAGIIEYILNSQRPDGSWDVYYGAENGDVNTTLECYYALRIFGFAKDDPRMAAAREWLLKYEWYKHVRVFTKYWLALFGEWDWAKTPALPPEIIYFPKWFPFNIYRFAAWARATIMPLCVVTSKKPVKMLAPELRIDELFPVGRETAYEVRKTDDGEKFSSKKIFLAADKIFHFFNDKSGDSALRKRAIKDAMDWIIEHQDDDGFWGGIQPPWIYGIIAMHILGYPQTQENMAKAINAVNLHWTEQTDKGTRIKASESPVWDTMLAVNALLDARTSVSDPRLSKAVDYLLENENRYYGDWSETVGRDVKPSGWSFQRANKFYPDIDDTAVAIVALQKYLDALPKSDPRAEKISGAIGRAAKWIVAMQSKNGGWAAFDRDNTTELVTKIPFCDFGEVLDPPSVDVSAHVVEALIKCGYSKDCDCVSRGIKFILDEQEDDGSWFGRWGINYVYGTWCAMTALKAAGFEYSSPEIKRAADWLASRQNPDGGWGERASTYMQPQSKSGSTASQTAWAQIALMSFETPYGENIRKGLDYLKSTQTPDGTWDEAEYTGTGFPGYGLGAKVDLRNGAPLPQGKELSRGFMLRYGYYCHYFPIMALSREIQ